MTLRNLACGAVAALALSNGAYAAAFTDEAAWRTAVSNVYALETWDTAATPIYGSVATSATLGLEFLPFADGTRPTVQPYDNTGGIRKSGANNLLNDLDYYAPGRGPINVAPLAGTFLYGLGMWNVGGDDRLVLSFYDAQNVLMESVTSSPSFGFFGIVNSAGASRAQVNFVEGNTYAPTDDWQTAARSSFDSGGAAPGVPEPATWALMISGFGIAGAALRRRRATVAF